MAESRHANVGSPTRHEQQVPAPLDVDAKLVIALLAIVCLALILGLHLGSSSEGSFPGQTRKALDSTAHLDLVGTRDWPLASTYTPASSDVAQLPDGPALALVDLRDMEAGFEDADVRSGGLEGTDAEEASSGNAILSPLREELPDIQDAIARIEEHGECSLLFLDLASGKALAYQAGQPLYTASASKAAMAYYALAVSGQELSEGSRASLEDSIVQSSNEGFFSYGYALFDSDYINWLAGYGIDHSLASGDFFLKASGRSMAAIWTDIEGYFEEGSPDARWLEGLFGKTSVSFIRNGLADSGATVYDKAGWIASGPTSTSDVGLIKSGGRTYVMAIVTSQPDQGSARERVADLAATLYGRRQLLR